MQQAGVLYLIEKVILHSGGRREFSVVDIFRSINGRFDRAHWCPIGGVEVL